MSKVLINSILFLLLTSITVIASSSGQLDNDPKTNQAIFDKLIGYEYNLWGVKAENKNGASEYEYTGRIFLDKRKGYKANFQEDEHFFFFKEKFTNGQIFKVPGSGEATRFINKAHINEYYVALKFGPQWKHHQLRDILENLDASVGLDVGCSDCNFAKGYYDLEKDWALTVYYNIKPIFKDSDLSYEEMAAELLAALNEKEGFGETEEVIVAESKPVVKEAPQPVIEKPVVSKPVPTPPVSNPEPARVVESIPIPVIVNQNNKSYHVLFRVLTNADQTFDDLTHLGPMFKETFDANGSTRYLIGNCSTQEEARSLEQKVNQAGYNATILASYKNGQLGKYIDSPASYSDNSTTYNSTNSVDNMPRGYGQPIQFTAIGNGNKTFDQLSHLGEVYSEKVEGRKLYRYKLRPYNDLDISEVVQEVKGKGFTGAFIVK